jgi:hypothetical protein
MLSYQERRLLAAGRNSLHNAREREKGNGERAGREGDWDLSRSR